MARSRAQPTKCEYFWRLANQESVILPSLERKLRKNVLCLNQSAISNFALYVIKILIEGISSMSHLPKSSVAVFLFVFFNLTFEVCLAMFISQLVCFILKLQRFSLTRELQGIFPDGQLVFSGCQSSVPMTIFF